MRRSRCSPSSCGPCSTGLALGGRGRRAAGDRGHRGPARRRQDHADHRPGPGLAAAGLRVVAVDGDIRQPSFDAGFHLRGASGLTDHLAGLASLDRIIEPTPTARWTSSPPARRPRRPLAVPVAGPAGLLRRLRATLRRRAAGRAAGLRSGGRPGAGRPRRRRAALRPLGRHAAPRRRRRDRRAARRRRQPAGAVLTRVDAMAHGRSGFADSEIYQPRYSGYFRGVERLRRPGRGQPRWAGWLTFTKPESIALRGQPRPGLAGRRRRRTPASARIGPSDAGRHQMPARSNGTCAVIQK